MTCLRGSMVGMARGLTFSSVYLQGYINLGTSENKLCTDLLTERVSRLQAQVPQEWSFSTW